MKEKKQPQTQTGGKGSNQFSFRRKTALDFPIKKIIKNNAKTKNSDLPQKAQVLYDLSKSCTEDITDAISYKNIAMEDHLNIVPQYFIPSQANQNRKIDEGDLQKCINSKIEIKIKKKDFRNNSSFKCKSLLNILLLGKSGLGKTSFIHSFSNLPFDGIQKKSTSLQIVTVKNIDQDVRFYDFPGYEENNIDSYISDTKILINSGQKRFHTNSNSLNAKQIKDSRLHVCLFFLSGPWVSDSDWQVMRKLYGEILIIPIIAKGDCYTISERKAIKEAFIQKNKREKIQFLNIDHIMNGNSVQNKQSESKFPWIIICCTESIFVSEDSKQQLVRQYKWGTCKLFEKKYNDFYLVKELICDYSQQILHKYLQSVNIKHQSFDRNGKKVLKRSFDCLLQKWLPLSLTFLAFTGLSIKYIRQQ